MPSNGGFFWCQKAYALLNNTHTRAPSLLSDTTELTQCSKITKNVTFQFNSNHNHAQRLLEHSMKSKRA